jgi:SAM-dependent methyltransferase
MKVIRRCAGPLGEIVIWENAANGSRMYLEGEIFQSHSTPAGDSQFTYVKMMEAFLAPPGDILVLGCGGGNIATMLARSGKTVTVVDHSPDSFDIARDYFGMPDDIPCVVEDFRTYLAAETRRFDGIAIDVGGPGFRFAEQFDSATCRAIRDRLAPGGRIIMNMLVANDFDRAPDQIGSDLSDDRLAAWIFDQPGFFNRNALIACLPRQGEGASQREVADLCRTDGTDWTPRHPRRRSNKAPPNAIDRGAVDQPAPAGLSPTSPVSAGPDHGTS